MCQALATKTALLLSFSSPHVLRGQRILQVRQVSVQVTFSKSLHLINLSVLISKMGLLLV